MELLIVALVGVCAAVAVVSAQDSSFQITSAGRRRRVPASSGGSSSRLRGSSGSSSQFPDFFRVEVEIQRLDNPTGVLMNGAKCDVLNACDPSVSAYLDVTQPRSPWPGAFSPSRWSIIYEATNNNSPRINRVITRDICGGSVNTVNARVKVSDADDTSGNDDIGDFECLFDVDPRDIGQPDMANWGPSTSCQTANGQGTSRLFARMHAFEIPSTSCKATTRG